MNTWQCLVEAVPPEQHGNCMILLEQLRQELSLVSFSLILAGLLLYLLATTMKRESS